MSTNKPTILYTITDEAPALATYSFLPILRRFAAEAGIAVETRDISLASRILAQFPDRLRDNQRQADDLAELGEIAKTPEANIIKLPNISASVPQLKAVIRELQGQGYPLPDYPDTPTSPEDKDIRARYDRVKGSAVNPVLREGNSDRRAPAAVKAFARANPHRMGAWSADSKSHVATMKDGDFRHTERSTTLTKGTAVHIELVGTDGSVTRLKEGLQLTEGEVIDAAVMRRNALTAFLREEVKDARKQGVLFSLHMKATMMKVSDPIIFGHAVRTYFEPVFTKHGETLERLGVNVNNGLGDLLGRIASLPDAERQAIENDLQAVLAEGQGLAMVDSDRGITNLHVPSDIIIDASMPVLIRDSGCMWNRDGKLETAKAVIPDSSYAGVYAEVIDFCREHGAFDPRTMGSIPNVGLMAQKAEEYGSHDKTFEIPAAGVVRVVTAEGETLLKHEVSEGDIWRMCQTRDAAIQDWVRLAVDRARASATPAVFWLDRERPHDAQLIAKVESALASLETSDVELHILAPAEATRFSLQRLKEGLDTISVTGNVLRDYLTDLFPILEVGTSAKMLSIVPLMAGGGLFETGAGGSAPKHVQQFVAQNYLRWDSLGEFLALVASLEHIADRQSSKAAALLARALDVASTRYLLEDKSPTRRLGGIDNRGSHFYLALYWAEALAEQTEDTTVQASFAPIAKAMRDNENAIVKELIAVQGNPVDIGGYFHPDDARAAEAMRPSSTLNAIING